LPSFGAQFTGLRPFETADEQEQKKACRHRVGHFEAADRQADEADRIDGAADGGDHGSFDPHPLVVVEVADSGQPVAAPGDRSDQQDQ